MNTEMINQLWWGSGESWNQLRVKLSAEVNLRELSDYGDNPVTTQTLGKLALVNVKGGTLSETTPMTRYYGIATYQDIQAALEEQRVNAEVATVILKLDTPGGNAKGVAGLAKYISEYNKPIISFTDTEQFSAGCWYGAACDASVASPQAEIGSVGVLMVHFSYKRQLEAEGVDVKVFRSARYKALGHPVEALSEDAIAEFDERIENAHNQFETAIAGYRNLPKSKVSQFANGKVYTAAKAQELGLIDDIMDFNTLVKSLLKGIK